MDVVVHTLGRSTRVSRKGQGFNARQTAETVLADLRRALDAFKSSVPEFACELEFPPAPWRGLGRLT